MRWVMPQPVHAEIARRVDEGADMDDYHVHDGDLILAMSHVEAGAPAVDFTRRIAQLPPGVDYPSLGHTVVYEGRLYRFVRVSETGDWALIIDQPGDETSAHRESEAGAAGGPRAGAGGLLGGGGGGSGGGGALDGEKLLLTDPPLDGTAPTEDPPSPIPLPGTLPLLALGLAALGTPGILGRAARRPGAR